MTIILRTQREHERIEGLAPVVNWREDDYAVLDNEVMIGRIYRTQLPDGMKWMWFLQTSPIAPQPNSGSAGTLDEAKDALAARYEAVRRLLAKALGSTTR